MATISAAVLALTTMTLAAEPSDAPGGLDHLWRPSDAKPARVTGTHQTIAAGKERVLATLDGPGVIRHIWFTAGLGTEEIVKRFHRGVILRAYWDDETEPSIDVPFGDFFAVGHGVQRPFECAVLSMTPYPENVRAGFNTYFPMPFKKKARLVLVNQMAVDATGVYWHIDYDRLPALPNDTLTFHATYRAARPVPREVPFVMCDAVGRGKYVGTVWSVHLLAPHSWVESREDFYVDGATEPTLPGTGSEDYYGQAWGYRAGLQMLYLGTSTHVPDGFGKWTAYRFHVPDPIAFAESIRVTMADRGFNIGYRCDDFATVTYWYQTEPHKAYPPLPPREDRLPLDHPESYAHGLIRMRKIEAGGDAAGAYRAADLLQKKYPKNSLAASLACRQADLLERSGQIDQAKTLLRKLRAGNDRDVARIADHKLWMLEQPGRALIKAYASSGVTVYVDGRKMHEADAWNMRDLEVVRATIGRGEHTIAVRAVCKQDEPLAYARMGTLQVWLDVAGEDARADATWKISDRLVDGWTKPEFDDSAWTAATEHTKLPDEAWFGLSGPGLRVAAYPLKRIWSGNYNPVVKSREPYFEELYARGKVTVP